MATAERIHPQPPELPDIRLELTGEEALALRILCYRTGGNGETTLRGKIDNVTTALDSVSGEYLAAARRLIAARLFSGSFYFEP